MAQKTGSGAGLLVVAVALIVAGAAMWPKVDQRRPALKVAPSGQPQLRFIATWSGDAPQAVVWTVDGVDHGLGQLAFQKGTHEFVHDTPYIPGQTYRMQVTSADEKTGRISCEIQINGVRVPDIGPDRGYNERTDPGSVRCARRG